MRDPITVIEAAYRVDGSLESWLENLAKAAAGAFGSTQGAMAFQYDASGGDWVHVSNLVVHGLPPAFHAEFFNQPDLSGEKARRTVKIFTTCQFDSMHALVDSYAPTLVEVLNRHHIEDMACINATDPTARGCAIAVADRSGPYPSRTVHAWRRLAAHIAAGHRLRRMLDAVAPVSPLEHVRTEAVLTPNGKVEHAVGAAEPRAARRALQDALVRMDRARSRSESDMRAIELWRALVSGRWSIVEHFDSDGKRYYLAHKNDPELARDRALTPREQQVLGYAELGHSNKLIAYSLGLAVSTVSTLLSNARRKLGPSLELMRSAAD